MRTKVLYIASALVLCGAVIIWFNKDFFLNLPGFFAWFVAGVTIVVLFASIMIKSAPATDTPQAAGTHKNKYTERREFPRIRHRLNRRPRFQIDDQELEVLDISERGLRFQNSAGLRFEDWVRGTLVFSDDSVLIINGLVARRQGDTVSLQLITTIPPDMIARENAHHLSMPGEEPDS
jgi:hypothetical protein